jgi:uncharacterized protein YcbK (DUF882 family)
MKKKIRFIAISLSIIVVLLAFYTQSLWGVKEQSKIYLQQLRVELTKQGYKPAFYTLCGRRYWLDNALLSVLGGASIKSHHLKGEAIDIVVLDVNSDGEKNAQDVEIVYNILDKKIIGNKGGIGTYKTENDFFSRQMVHFDCRGTKARWK